MALKMDKPKAVAACLLAGYREWTVKSFRGAESTLTTIDPDERQPTDPAGRFKELVGRVSFISEEKLNKPLVPWPDHEKVVLYSYPANPGCRRQCRAGCSAMWRDVGRGPEVLARVEGGPQSNDIGQDGC